jgi:uncharacterized Zn finger protein
MSFDDRFPPASKPRKAKGGIKARSQRGAFGTQWWAKRWIAVLEGFNLGTRLQRGRSYARAGQVLDISIVPGRVTARVQGSRARPYNVSIRVEVLGKPTWHKVAEHLTSEARFSANLLAGEIPHDIEDAFRACGASLFPATLHELQTECSCPDWANPCKHVAATYYLLGEEFDRDPFLLFALRGGVREQLLSEIRSESTKASASAAEPVSLPDDLAAFWNGPADVDAAQRSPSSAAKATKRALPAFPFWRGAEPLEATLDRVDERAVASALTLLSAYAAERADL